MQYPTEVAVVICPSLTHGLFLLKTCINNIHFITLDKAVWFVNNRY